MLSFLEKKSHLVSDTVDGNADDKMTAQKRAIRMAIFDLFNMIQKADEKFCPEQKLVIDEHLGIEQIWAQVQPFIAENREELPPMVASIQRQSNEIVSPSVEVPQKGEGEIPVSRKKKDVHEDGDREALRQLKRTEPRNSDRRKAEASNEVETAEYLEEEEEEEEEEDLTEDEFSNVRKTAPSAMVEDQEIDILTKKPWNLTGESTARHRQKNSLVEQDFQIEYALKTAPKPTEESTKNLEDIIKERIKSKTFDDPHRKQHFSLPNDLVRSQSDHGVSQKNRKSLAELYDSSANDLQANTQESQDELKCLNMWKELLGYLDALSSCTATTNPFVETFQEQPRVKVDIGAFKENLNHKKSESKEAK